MNTLEQTILDYIQSNPGCSQGDILNYLGITRKHGRRRKSARNAIKTLVNANKIAIEGTVFKRHYSW